MIGSWSRPPDHGPSRRTILISAAAALLLLVIWGLLGTGWLGARGDGGPKQDFVVEITPEGALVGRLDDGKSHTVRMRNWGVEGASSPTFAAAQLKLPRTRDGAIVRVVVEPGPGIRGSDVTLRLESEDSLVRVRHPEGRAPTAQLEQREDGGSSPATVTVTVPAASVDTIGAERGGTDIDELTTPIDERLRTRARDYELLLDLRRHAPLFIVLGLLGAIAPATLSWWFLARSFFVRPTVGHREDSVSVPELIPAVIGVLRTTGADDLPVGRAFVTTILDLLARGVLRARRAEVGPRAYGVLIGRPIELVEESDAMTPNDETMSEAAPPDSP